MTTLSVKDANKSIKRTLSLISSLDIQYRNPQTGKNINRRKIIEAKGLTTLKNKITPTSRVAALNEEIGKICGAQLGAKVEIFLGGKKIDGRLMVGKLM